MRGTGESFISCGWVVIQKCNKYVTLFFMDSSDITTSLVEIVRLSLNENKNFEVDWVILIYI